MSQLSPTRRGELSADGQEGQKQLATLQDEVFFDAITNVQDQLAFAELEENATEPPESWIEAYGEARAWKRFRIASAAWRSRNNAPVGLTHATQVVLGIMKSRSMEKAAPRHLNISIVNMAPPDAAQTQYPEIVVPPDE